jgi:hypothetical protein
VLGDITVRHFVCSMLGERVGVFAVCVTVYLAGCY